MFQDIIFGAFLVLIAIIVVADVIGVILLGRFIIRLIRKEVKHIGGIRQLCTLTIITVWDLRKSGFVHLMATGIGGVTLFSILLATGFGPIEDALLFKVALIIYALLFFAAVTFLASRLNKNKPKTA